MRIDAQRMCLCRGSRRFAFPFASLSGSIRQAVFTVIRMSFLVFQHSRLFDPPTIRVEFDTLAADRLNGHLLSFAGEQIDGGFDQPNRPLAFLLVVFQQPGVWLDRIVGHFLRW